MKEKYLLAKRSPIYVRVKPNKTKDRNKRITTEALKEQKQVVVETKKK